MDNIPALISSILKYDTPRDDTTGFRQPEPGDIMASWADQIKVLDIYPHKTDLLVTFEVLSVFENGREDSTVGHRDVLWYGDLIFGGYCFLG